MPGSLQIAAVLSDMDAKIAALEARRDKTRLLKQGMSCPSYKPCLSSQQAPDSILQRI